MCMDTVFTALDRLIRIDIQNQAEINAREEEDLGGPKA